MTELAVNLSKTIHAPIEKVFDAWLDPHMLTRFILPAPDMPNPEVETDPREGGRFTIIMHVGDDKLPHTGSYLVLERPNKLVFSWASAYSTEDSTVSLEFTALDDSSTRVDLTHVRFLHEEARSDHEGGWSRILDHLADLVQLS